MKVKESITSKYTYTEVKIVSENQGAIVFNAKRSDTGNKIMIFGQRINDQSTKKYLLQNSKKALSIPHSEYLQKYVQKPFLSPIDSEKNEDIYCLMPFKYSKNALQSNLASFSLSEKLEIAYKIAKGVQFLHNEANTYHGNLELSTIFCKKLQSGGRYSIKIIPPFPLKVIQSRFEESILSVYRVPSQKPSKKVDIWSLGIIFYELFTGAQLLLKKEVKTTPQILDNFVYGLNIKEIKSNNIQKLVKSMLNRDVEGRIEVEEVLSTLKSEVLKDLYGQQYIIPLIEEEKIKKKDSSKQMKFPVIRGQLTENRIILKHFVLAIRLVESTRIAFSLHLRENYQTLIDIEYYFTQFSPEIQQKFQSLPKLYNQLCKKNKKNLRFASNGALVFYQKSNS